MTLGAGGRADATRLEAIADATDESTRALLGGLDLPAGARVVDVGAGTGSVALWWARTLPGATVWALDQDASLLAGLRGERVEVVEDDVAAWAPPSPVDAVHARFVLAHHPDRDALVARLAGWLAPGGALVLTEPYHLPYGGPGDPRVAEVLAAYRRHASDGGLDFGFSRRAAGLMSAAGAAAVTVSVRAGRLGGGPAVDRWAPLVERVADDLDVSADALDAFRAYAADPAAHDIPQMIVSTVGRWPSGRLSG